MADSLVSFKNDIFPLFTKTDIDHMSFMFDLSNYNDVKTNSADILDRLQAIGGDLMPPKTAGGPWSPAQIALFKKWIDDGFQP
jgi:hypothetical protein